MMLLLDILVFVFGVLGAILLIYKQKIGFICFILHSILWFVLSLHSHNIMSAVTCIVFIFIDLFGYLKWSNENDK